ncbi:hypothetical protein [Shimia sp.]|uniref:hypothetical protein n=1 Tax=Shimia sp. TaxID=1954381 RepID=UPI0032968811
MTFKAICTAALVLATGITAQGLAHAQTSAQPSPISALRLSAELFAMGQTQQDPLLVLTAAKLRKSVSLSPTDRAPTGGQVETGTTLEWQTMLETAAALAAADDALLGLIEDVRFETSKGVSDGPVYSVAIIGAGGTDEYESLPFTGGDYAEIYVEGKGNTDLNLYVYDAQGRLVCSDTDISDIAYCGWRPATTSGFRIEVRNKGDANNQYALITN